MAAVVLFFVTGCAEVQRAVPALGPIIARTGINPTTMNVIAAGIPLTAFIGNRVARYLVNDQEKEQVARATVETAATGKPQDVSTSTGARVTTTPAAADAKTKTTRAATDAKTKTTTPAAPDAKTKTPPAVETAATATQECRTVTQTIVLENGTRDAENVTVCKREDGLWESRG